MSIDVASKYRSAWRRVVEHRNQVSAMRGFSPATRNGRVAFSRSGGSAAKATGFTLIELMVVVAIIGILMALAVVSYDWVMVKSRRGAAQGCLIEAAQVMERGYTLNMTYSGAAYPNLACSNDLAGYYNFSLDGAATATTYTLQAIPTSSQHDNKCGTLKITNTGVKTPATEGCWQ